MTVHMVPCKGLASKSRVYSHHISVPGIGSGSNLTHTRIKQLLKVRQSELLLIFYCNMHIVIYENIHTFYINFKLLFI